MTRSNPDRPSQSTVIAQMIELGVQAIDGTVRAVRRGAASVGSPMNW